MTSIWCSYAFLYVILHCSFSAQGKRMSILFLVSDDMRAQLGSYSGPDFPSPVHPPMHTPRLDSLASRSLLLKRAYVQQAVCSPSRASFLTGRRPDTTHVYDLQAYFREVGGNFTTIPQYFKENGYTSIGIGKIFHPGHASGHDDPISWSEPYYHAPNLHFWDGPLNRSNEAVVPSVRKLKPLPDEQIAEYAIKTLGRIAPKAHSGEQPFFLAVGFHRPHLPFVFPEEFLKFYPEESIRVPDNQFAPVNMPEAAWNNYNELRRYYDLAKFHPTGEINTTLPKDIVLTLRRAYYSSVSFMDSLVGRVLDELDRVGLRDSTIVSFLGDHGWQLGEHGEWCKETNFELATHAPLMVSVPGLTDQGMPTEALAEFVDLFPTLVDAAGLPPMPLCPEDSSKVKLCREGSSLFPLIKNATSVPWKDRVFSQYPRKGKKVMGYTMRTPRYRYTEWAKFSQWPVYKPDWNTLYGTELYDHLKDPEENYNRAKDPAFQDMRKTLSTELHAGWRAVIPPSLRPQPEVIEL